MEINSGLVGGDRMSALKDLSINGLKNIKINGLKYLKINELKHLVPKPGGQDDMELGDLIKSKKEVEIKIRNLFREKKELEFRIEQKEIESRIEKEDTESQRGQLQKTKNEESEEISEFPWREEIFPPLSRNKHREVSGFLEVETGSLQKEDAGISERMDSQIDKKVENPDNYPESKEIGEIEGGNITEIEVKEEAKSASEKNDMKCNEEADLSNIRKKAREVTFPENKDKTENIEAALKDDEKGEYKIPALGNNEKEKDKTPEKRNNKNESPAPGIFGNSLIQELLESEDLCTEEEQSFMKYIEESSVVELITDLRDVKKLLAKAGH
jgi:hypothetical protein